MFVGPSEASPFGPVVLTPNAKALSVRPRKSHLPRHPNDAATHSLCGSSGLRPRRGEKRFKRTQNLPTKAWEVDITFLEESVHVQRSTWVPRF